MKHYQQICLSRFTSIGSKVKDEFNLKLQTHETMKLFGSTVKIMDKTKNGESVPNIEC